MNANRPFLLVILVSLLVLGCGKPPGADLANLNYPVEFAPGGRATLVNGEWSAPAAPGSATRMVVRLLRAASGDLDDDGINDAVVVLVSEPGGSGTFYFLVPVVAGNAGQATLIGDRIEVRSLDIRAGVIELTIGSRGPQDPMSAITRQEIRLFRLDGQQLQPIDSADGSPVSGA